MRAKEELASDMELKKEEMRAIGEEVGGLQPYVVLRSLSWSTLQTSWKGPWAGAGEAWLRRPCCE